MIEAWRGEMMASVNSVLIVTNWEEAAKAFPLDEAEVARMDGLSLSLVWAKMASLVVLEEASQNDYYIQFS